MSVPVMHYIESPLPYRPMACGAGYWMFRGTDNPAEVTCKSCLRTHSYRKAMP